MRPPQPAENARGTGREGGFTLIEMLVVLVLLSLMSVVVVESYRAGLAMWERQHRESASFDTARVLLERIRAQIKSANPWSFRSQGRMTLYLRGRKDALDFTTLVGLSSRLENGVLHAVRYALEESADGMSLRVEEYGWPRRGFPEGEEPLVGEAVPGVEGFALSYQVEERKAAAAADGALPGSGGQTTERRWTDSWPEEGGPKRGETLTAVSVSIKMAGTAGESEEFTAVIPVLQAGSGSEVPR